jgi:hypothetical protein
MQTRRKTVDLASISRANYANRNRIDTYRKLLSNVDTDPRKKDRLAKHECRLCFYSSRVSTCAFTRWACAFCGSVAEHPNGSPPVVCKDCAKTAKICVQCGADIDCVDRRKRELPPVVEVTQHDD